MLKALSAVVLYWSFSSMPKREEEQPAPSCRETASVASRYFLGGLGAPVTLSSKLAKSSVKRR